MKRYPRIYGIIFLTTLLFGCGGGDGTKSNDAALANLILEGATLDQLFQSSQFEYTADVNFLAASVTVTAKTSDANARVMINDTSGDTAVIPLAEGPNYIDILVTAEDGASRTDYSVAVSRAALGSFSQQAYLKASNPDASDRLGRSVAVQGETLVVGTPYESSNAVDGESDNSLYHSGAAYVFTRSAGVWTQQAYLKASNPGDRDGFGTSVGIEGDTLIVGAEEGPNGCEATVLGPGMG